MKSLKALPKGRIQEAGNCPIARSFPHCVCIGIDRLTTSREMSEFLGEEIKLYDRLKGYYIYDSPPFFREFTEQFDLGAYPDLIEEAVSSSQSL